jgi:putative heme-binding domain-containing protein
MLVPPLRLGSPSFKPFRFSAVCLALGLTLGFEATWADESVPTDRAAEPATPAAWYGEGVRPTDARTPEEERQGFHLPPGFVAELVAAEPQISKPLNMAFDARGRLWVTDTLEYPYQAPAGQPAKDTLRVLEDTDGDGSFDRTTTFADNLNIPIGILPYGEGAICFSIPNIWYLRDTDGDGRCDQRDKLLGPFDTTRDTHGMINALRRGDDGWIYACHGFNNQSTVAGSDGHKITLISGNTFRFRPDGSRCEVVSLGQVNPFGMDSDERGQYYTADCHSKPITQVIPGACYPSFGRPHDGLGFAHSMMDHLHGSTAICGLVFYQGQQFPSVFHESFISGNVMTSRLNRNLRQRIGATELAIEQGDFMTSDDPWFRPVDLRLGPDGALYVADFYNKIIGHYEVPLPHPGRDRYRGRIWRIRYAPEQQPVTSARLTLTEKSPAELIALLSSDNATLRRLALDQLTDRCGATALPDLQQAVKSTDLHTRYLAMWGLARIGRVESTLLQTLARDPAPLVRLHVARLLGEFPPTDAQGLLELLADNDADVARVAAESLGRGADPNALLPLLQKLHSYTTAEDIKAKDNVTIQTLRIAIRNLLQREQPRNLLVAAWTKTPSLAAHYHDLELSGPYSSYVASILLGLAHPDAAKLLQMHLASTANRDVVDVETLQHIARWSEADQLPKFIQWLQASYSDNTARQLQLLASIESGLASRGVSAPDAVRQWSLDLARKLLLPWTANEQAPQLAISWGVDAGELWKPEQRHCDDGVDYLSFRSSLTRGESYTGTMRSAVFSAPASLTFWLVGHNGFPDQADKQANRCELVAADTGEILQRELPPRSDIARLVHWDLSSLQGRAVYVRCIDDDNGTAYAWVGVGRFSLPSLNADGAINDLRDALRLVARYSLTELKSELAKTAMSAGLDDKGQLEALAVLAQLQERTFVQSCAEFASQDLSLAQPWNASLQAALSLDATEYTNWLSKDLVALVRSLSSRQQASLVRTLAVRSQNLAWLADSFEAGLLSNAVLNDQTLRAMLNGAFKSTAAAERWSKVVDSIPAEDEATLQRWSRLVATPLPAGDDVSKGRALFVEKCSQCHQLAGQGKLVGPQLDGVGKRTQERLLEDILLPNRNVDHAFRTSTLLLDDGRIVVGLVRSETDDALTMVDGEGKEQTISKVEASERKQNTQSVMPGNLHEVLDDAALLQLLQFLKSQP